MTTERLLTWNAGLRVGLTTRDNAWRSAKQMFAYLLSCGYIDSNPAKDALRTPKPAKRKVVPFETWAEVETVSAKAGKYGALILLMCATGMRPQEIFALDWKWIDAKRRKLYIEQTVKDGRIEEGPKTEESQGAIWLSQRALDAIALIRDRSVDA